MERLTERWCKGMVRIKGCSTGYPDKERKGAPAANAIVHLADYEDTGMTPKQVRLISNVLQEVGETYNCWFDYVVNCVLENSHLKELAQAEKDGRLVVLPCKMGDTVWCISKSYKTISQYTVAGYLNDGFRWKVRMTKTIPSWVGNKMEHKYVAFNSFGKTVFLTREEAEAALKKMEEADNEID